MSGRNSVENRTRQVTTPPQDVARQTGHDRESRSRCRRHESSYNSRCRLTRSRSRSTPRDRREHYGSSIRRLRDQERELSRTRRRLRALEEDWQRSRTSTTTTLSKIFRENSLIIKALTDGFVGSSRDKGQAVGGISGYGAQSVWTGSVTGNYFLLDLESSGNKFVSFKRGQGSDSSVMLVSSASSPSALQEPPKMGVADHFLQIGDFSKYIARGGWVLEDSLLQVSCSSYFRC
ncbi:hypothetical protein ACJJTC_005003 [Scirpophaga incertulas]